MRDKIRGLLDNLKTYIRGGKHWKKMMLVRIFIPSVGKFSKISNFQCRNMSNDSIFSRMKGQAMELMYGNPEQNFVKMTTSLVSNEPFTLKSVTKSLIEENLNGWRAKVSKFEDSSILDQK